jgi:hypothetical protein
MFRATAFAAAVLLLPGICHSQDKPLTPQQERMKNCNADAKGKQLKGEERQQFMSSCLKGESAGPARTAQQEKMKTCNREASDKHMKGDERRQFMSSCLKAHS